MLIFWLSNLENEILKFLWSSEKPSTFREIYDSVKIGKKKKLLKATLRESIYCLEDRGYVGVELGDKNVVYFPVTSQTEHSRLWYKRIFKEIFRLTTRSLILSLSGGAELTKVEIAELEEAIDETEDL